MPTDRDYWKTSKVVYRRKPQKRQALFTKTRLALIGVLILLGLLYLGAYKLLRLPYFQIMDIKIEGLIMIPESDIRKFMESGLSGDKWHLIPKSNILFFSPRSASIALGKAYPAVREVTIKKIFPREVSVAIQERTLFAIYCARSGEVESCFFMDRDGVLFRQSPNIQGTLILKFASDAASPSLGASIFTPEEIVKFESWLEEFKNKVGLRVSSFQFKQNSPKDIWLGTDGGFYVIVTKDSEPSKTAEIVKTVLDNEVKNNRAKLEYIDARFGNKVFYKLK
ncbi:MAG: FtsQ-type POTRA domain-containing protein [Candidatus Sungbacteria bacterium]|nr:FtsQ-type POTRA domain-containing protein [Candidatus Sungbacteria bacterium]